MNVVGRMLYLARPHQHWLLLATGLSVVGIVASVALVAASASLISLAAIVDNVAEIALVITAVRVLAIVRSGAVYLERIASHRAAFRILTEVRTWFVRGIEPLAPAGFVHRRSGDLLARVVADVDALRDLSVRVLVPPAAIAIASAIVVAALAFMDPFVAIVVLACLVGAGTVVPLVAGHVTRTDAPLEASLRGEIAGLAIDEVLGVADLVALGAAEGHRRRLLATAARRDRLRQRARMAETGSDAAVLLFATIAVVASLALTIPLVLGGRVDGVLLAAVPLATLATFEAVAPISRSFRLFDTSRAAAARLFDIVERPAPVTDPQGPRSMPQGNELEMSDVCFRYAPDERWVLQGLSFDVGPGERLAIVGPSGVGKSTVADLWARFWEPQAGTLRLGGVDVGQLVADEVRARIGFVPQQVQLFATSIRENLLVADPLATDEQLAAACRVAQLDAWIETLPRGLDTLVGEDGIQLSGGERRRIGAARLVLKGAPIAILDEPTADLDRATAERLWSALDPFLSLRTVIVLAHGPTAIRPGARVIRLT